MKIVDAFMEYISSEKQYSPHTLVAYQNDLLQFTEFVEETYEEEDLTQVHYPYIRDWIVQLKELGLSNKSINRKISTLQLFYRYLLKLNEIEVSPLAKHRSLKSGKREEIPFSEKEIEEVLGGFDQDFSSIRNALMIELLYATGIRRAELAGLQDASVDLEASQLSVVGKRNKERIIPLLPSLHAKIKNYLEKKQQLSDSPFFFIKDSGKPITADFVYYVVTKAFENSSTKQKKSPHILRHSFATHLLNNGANLAEIKDLLGHASLASTQVYTHNSIAKLKSAYKAAHPRSNS